MSCIYLISNSRDAFKIGFSTQPPETRRAALQTASPELLVLLYSFDGAREDEQDMHERFAAKRLRGEWFALDADDIRDFVRFATGRSLVVHAPNISATGIAAVRALIDELDDEDQDMSERLLLDLIDDMGGVVEGYPLWHPLAALTGSGAHIQLTRDAVIVCSKPDGTSCVTDVGPELRASVLPFPLYTSEHQAVLIRLAAPIEYPIATSRAMRLVCSVMDARAVRESAPWGDVFGSLLGAPCRATSSAFITKEVGESVRAAFDALNACEFWGPVPELRWDELPDTSDMADPLEDWFQTACSIDSSSPWLTTTELFARFLSWADGAGRSSHLSAGLFSRAFKAVARRHGIPFKRSGGSRYRITPNG